MVGAMAGGSWSTPRMIPAVVGGPFVEPQLLAGPTVLPVMEVPVTTSLGACAWTMMPPSNDPLMLLPLTVVLLTVAPAEAAATTIPPRSGPVDLKTPMCPVIVLPVMTPPEILPPALWVEYTIPHDP